MAEYIKREDVLEFSRIFDDQLWETGGYRIYPTEAVPVNAIRNIPSADVRPVVRGKWLPDYDYMEYDFDGSTPLPEPLKFQDGWQCSLCGEYTPSETNYCPNCGADMRGGI